MPVTVRSRPARTDRAASRSFSRDVRARPHHAARRPSPATVAPAPTTDRVDPAGDRRGGVDQDAAAGGVQVGGQVVAGRPGVEVGARVARPPPARRRASAGRHTARDQLGLRGPAGPRTYRHGSSEKPAKRWPLKPLGRRPPAGDGRPSRRTVSPSQPSSSAAMSGARRPLGVGQVGVGVADQHAPPADPVAQVADAAGRAERAVRLDGDVGAVADVRDDLVGRGRQALTATTPGPARPSAGEPGERAVEQRHVADRAQRLGQRARSAGAAAAPRRRRARPRRRSLIVGASG